MRLRRRYSRACCSSLTPSKAAATAFSITSPCTPFTFRSVITRRRPNFWLSRRREEKYAAYCESFRYPRSLRRRMTSSIRVCPYSDSQSSTRARKRRFNSATVRIRRARAATAYLYSSSSEYDRFLGREKVMANDSARKMAGEEKEERLQKERPPASGFRKSEYRTAESGSRFLPSAEAGRLHGLPGDVGRGGDTLHAQFEVVGVGGVLQSGLVVHQARLEQVPQRLIEGLHAVLRCAGRDSVANGASLLGHENALPNEGSIDHHLDSGDAALGVATAHQALAHNGAQHSRQLQPNLFLLGRRKNRDDAVDGF